MPCMVCMLRSAHNNLPVHEIRANLIDALAKLDAQNIL